MEFYVSNIPLERTDVVSLTTDVTFDEFLNIVISAAGETDIKQDYFDIVIGGDKVTEKEYPGCLIGVNELDVQLSAKGDAMMSIRKEYGGDVVINSDLLKKTIFDNNIELFELLLQAGVSADFEMLLLEAVSNGREEMVEKLLTRINIIKDTACLSCAITKNELTITRMLLSHSPTLQFARFGPTKDSGLIMAAEIPGLLSMVKVLVDTSFSENDISEQIINAKNALNKSALATAVENRNDEVASYLLSVGAKVCDHCMAAESDLSILTRLLDGGGNPSAAVHQCCLQGNSEKLSKLIQRGASITPDHLIVAAMNNVQSVEFLLSYFSDHTDNDTFLETVDSENRSLLHISLIYGRIDVAECLLRNNVDITSRLNVDVFRLAVLRGRLDFARLFFQYGGSTVVDAPSKNGITALSRAANEGKSEMVDFLVSEAKADVNIAGGKYINIPLHRAARCGDVRIVNTLIMAGSKVNTEDSKGYTALLVAAEGGHHEVVRTLLEHGADPKVKHIDYCLNCVVSKGYLQVARHLIEFGAPATPFIHTRVGVAVC
eukprot:TRINITY_DN12341_c4_g1_i1.p1 TRINITY_DN12341_c4_g1~~TRINITY_DN12341_c4_g1_i1.p1  ORF type:complete len:572 (+),score=121.50 TRINITY_DN12341_c4_g1_i1:75-1718(+)